MTVMTSMRKQNRTFLFLNIVLLGIFIFSCSKKEEQKKIEEQFSDTVKTGSDSIFASSTSKFTSNEVRKKFNEIKKKYENELDVVANTEVRFSDLNGDGKDEALLYYGLAAKGGNAMTGSGLILYKINDDKLEFLSDYNLDGAVIKSIKDGQLNCVKYEYAAGDPSCCPSKKKPFKLKFENNKLNFIP
jgi:hypothetical protein